MKVYIVFDSDGWEIKGILKVLVDRESARKYVRDEIYKNIKESQTTKQLDSHIFENVVESYKSLF